MAVLSPTLRPAPPPNTGALPAGAARAAAPHRLASTPRPGLHVTPRGGLWLLLVSLLAAMSGLIYLVQTGDVAGSGYDLQRLQAQRAEWELKNQQLELELAKLHSLAWIEAEATGRLGMRKPSNAIYLRLDSPPPLDPPRAEPTAVPTPPRPDVDGLQRLADGFASLWSGVHELGR